jgi:phosphatidylserine decarboxylase
VFRWIAFALGGLPLGAISRLAGRAARARPPGWLLQPAIGAFGRVFGVDFDEAREPVESFRTFQDFFTRALRDGARSIDPAPDAFVSPCDGAWGAAGTIERGTLLQVKGRPYSLAALLGSEAEARLFERGRFATLYLAPGDYHRFHAPADVRVVSAHRLPGRLWPVNRIGLEGVDGVFARNERICAWMRLARAGSGSAEPDLCLVAVGATLVGSVRLVFDSLATNEPGSLSARREYEPPVELARGAEWGRFEFGSTIVVLARAGAVEIDARTPGTRVRLGERIGTTLGSLRARSVLC